MVPCSLRTSSLLHWNKHWLLFMQGVTPSFFTRSLNLISVMRLWQYSNSMLNKPLLSAFLIHPLIHMIIIDTTTTIQIHTAVFTVLLMLIPWALMDPEINIGWCYPGFMSDICHKTSTQCWWQSPYHRYIYIYIYGPYCIYCETTHM